MDNHVITETDLENYRNYLLRCEKRKLTIEKYIRDLRKLNEFLGDREITKESLIEYKKYLIDNYSVSSINSMLSAINSYMEYAGWTCYKVKALKSQRKVYCPKEKELTKEEYFRLVDTARKKHRERIGLIIQTICSTGIRISELDYVTVEAAEKGEITVECKGKYRQVFMPKKLQEYLIQYIRQQNIGDGRIFVTKSGTRMNRSNIWKEMKALCREARVPESKVFPHNLRHLFARTYYTMEKDIAKLADLLGHSSIDTTRIYIMTSGEEHRRQIEEMKLV